VNDRDGSDGTIDRKRGKKEKSTHKRWELSRAVRYRRRGQQGAVGKEEGTWRP